MKIYVNQLNIDMAKDFVDIFQPYLHKKEVFVEVFTNEGWYHVDHKRLYKLDVDDQQVISYPNFFKNVTLIADYSTHTKLVTKSLCGSANHAPFTVCNYIYRIPSHTHIRLIIQFVVDHGGSNMRPRDIFFEMMDEDKQIQAKSKHIKCNNTKIQNKKARVDQQLVTKRDIDDLFVKNELIEFLSYLF